MSNLLNVQVLSKDDQKFLKILSRNFYQKIINIILDLFKNRKLHVIISNGSSPTIIAGDGIDQGETISLLLWRIFYDPLLEQINNSTRGYVMTNSMPASKAHLSKSFKITASAGVTLHISAAGAPCG